MTEPLEPPEGEVEGPTEPIPGGQPALPPQPSGPVHGTYLSRNAGRRASLLQYAAEIVNQSQLDAIEVRIDGEVQNLGTVVDSYGDALKEKVGPEAVPTIAPLSQAINRRADPTFQLSDFMSPPMSGTDSRGDTVTVNPGALKAAANVKGRRYFSFITPLINRAYEQLNFMVSGVSGTPCRMDVAVYVLDGATKSLTRQVLVEDAAAGLTFNESVVTVTFPRWVATQGSYVCISWLQHGTGEVRSLLGLDEAQRPLWDGVFPPKISARSDSTAHTTLPATVDGSSASAVNFAGYWFNPYAELSEAISVILRYFQDPFTSDSNQWIARPWVGLTDNQIRVSVFGWAGIPQTAFITAGTRAAVYDTPLSTDWVTVAALALADSAAVGPGAFSFLAVRTTNNMTTGVGVFYSVDTIQIRTWNVGHADQIHASSTVRATTSWTLGTSSTFSATWEDGVLTVRDENEATLISWSDTVTSAEARYRFTGIGFERTGGASSPRLDHWVARDLPAPDDEEESED